MTSEQKAPPSGRLVSLDVLRGFDMCWILGADAVVHALARVWDVAPLRLLAGQMEHKLWDGFAAYDLIFPLFVFISGVAHVFALPKALAQEPRSLVVRRILLRAGLLFLLGILYNGGLAEPWPAVRLVGVLQRIALAYAVTGILFCFVRTRTLAVIAVALLLGYWALLAWTPVRDVTLTAEAVSQTLGTSNPSPEQVRQLYASSTATVTHSYVRGRNLPNHVDYLWLPGAMYRKYWDPEGVLSTVPAAATCLLGVLAGRWLRREDLPGARKAAALAGVGTLAVALGWLWHPFFPVVKDLWSSSFVLVAGGWSLWLLAIFYYVVDVRGWRGAWCQPLLWIGLNPITLYLASSLVPLGEIAGRLFGGSVAARLDRLLPGLGGLTLALAVLGLVLLLARFLHRRQIYLRV